MRAAGIEHPSQTQFRIEAFGRRQRRDFRNRPIVVIAKAFARDVNRSEDHIRNADRYRDEFDAEDFAITIGDARLMNDPFALECAKKKVRHRRQLGGDDELIERPADQFAGVHFHEGDR